MLIGEFADLVEDGEAWWLEHSPRDHVLPDSGVGPERLKCVLALPCEQDHHALRVLRNGIEFRAKTAMARTRPRARRCEDTDERRQVLIRQFAKNGIIWSFL